jgi:hypothetical protein
LPPVTPKAKNTRSMEGSTGVAATSVCVGEAGAAAVGTVAAVVDVAVGKDTSVPAGVSSVGMTSTVMQPMMKAITNGTDRATRLRCLIILTWLHD